MACQGKPCHALACLGMPWHANLCMPFITDFLTDFMTVFINLFHDRFYDSFYEQILLHFFYEQISMTDLMTVSCKYILWQIL